MTGIRAEVGRRPPLLVKIAPDLPDEQIDAIAELALELEFDGIVAVNTTIAREGLRSSDAAVEAAGSGGLSGDPLQARALEVLQRLHARTAGRVVLISVGGIETAADVWERLRAGASLVQAYTGFVYGGPLWARRLNRGLERAAAREWPRHARGGHGDGRSWTRTRDLVLIRDAL